MSGTLFEWGVRWPSGMGAAALVHVEGRMAIDGMLRRDKRALASVVTYRLEPNAQYGVLFFIRVMTVAAVPGAPFVGFAEFTQAYPELCPPEAVTQQAILLARDPPGGEP